MGCSTAGHQREAHVSCSPQGLQSGSKALIKSQTLWFFEKAFHLGLSVSVTVALMREEGSSSQSQLNPVWVQTNQL